MANPKYIDFYQFDNEKVEQLLNSAQVENKNQGLLYTVLGGYDYDKSDSLIFDFINSNETYLQQTAVLCIGHLVRIHGEINLTKYIPILENILANQIDFLVGNAEGAVNDIWIFYDREKIEQEVNKDSCVGRYFNVLQISELSEEGKVYKKGIEKLQKLQITESNPSIRSIQDTCIEFLNYSL